VTGSSPKTSSSRVVIWMEASIEAVGVVVTSPGGKGVSRGLEKRGVRRGAGFILRKSNAAGPGVDQAFGGSSEGVWTPLLVFVPLVL